MVLKLPMHDICAWCDSSTCVENMRVYMYRLNIVAYIPDTRFITHFNCPPLPLTTGRLRPCYRFRTALDKTDPRNADMARKDGNEPPIPAQANDAIKHGAELKLIGAAELPNGNARQQVGGAPLRASLQA